MSAFGGKADIKRTTASQSKVGTPGLQEYARTELGMGLSFCFVFDCFDDAPAANLVQVEGLDLTFGISDGSYPPPP
jgi:hypothetical protein